VSIISTSVRVVEVGGVRSIVARVCAGTTHELAASARVTQDWGSVRAHSDILLAARRKRAVLLGIAADHAPAQVIGPLSTGLEQIVDTETEGGLHAQQKVAIGVVIHTAEGEIIR